MRAADGILVDKHRLGPTWDPIPVYRTARGLTGRGA
jgi:hypothetical protein